MSVRILAAALVVLAACGGSRGAASAPAPTHAPTHSASATPLASSFDDMMGAVPAATAYVVSGREVLAVTLLNHFVRYRIAVGDNPQLAVSPDGTRLYVADELQGDLRLRWFDVPSGSERAQLREKIESVGGPVRTGIGRGAVAIGRGGQLLLLREPAGSGLVVEARDDFTLRNLGGVFKKQGCADRLIASPSRIAIVCLRNIAEFWIEGVTNELTVEGDKVDGLVGATMLPDGTIVGAYPDGAVKRVPLRARDGRRESWLLRAALVRDGIASPDPGRIVLAHGGDRPRVYVYGAEVGDVRGNFPLPNAPASGILAFGQFAYWVDADGTGVYHVDLASGLVEKMYGPLEKGAFLAALAPR